MMCGVDSGISDFVCCVCVCARARTGVCVCARACMCVCVCVHLCVMTIDNNIMHIKIRFFTFSSKNAFLLQCVLVTVTKWVGSMWLSFGCQETLHY